ncbi:MAG: thiamine pyrophosphate protein binding domain protein [Polaromonas sp.]|nr:thiamine pyrophosphate protein binding domain protein [Polaromonas sp.]
MSATVADFMLERLSQWGVKRLYGYPGDGINGILGALGRAEGKMAFVQARHEELAAFMACAHAKFTGEVGVCLATSGPGAIHLLNGLYDAKLDHQPVVAIVGQQKRSALGGDYQQEVDLVSLFKDVAHEFVQMATAPEQMRHLVDRAMQIARDRRAVTCIIVPNDVQDLPAVPVPPREHGTVHSGVGTNFIATVPPIAGLRAAAAVLNAGSKVALLVGAGALHATDEIIAVADVLGAGVAKALLGKAAVPDSLPYVTGCIGILGTSASSQMMEECDTLLMVGSSFPYAEFLPPEGQARGVQIDIDPRFLNLRYPMEVGLVGDSRATLAALLPLLERKTSRAWQAGIEENVAHWWQTLQARAMVDASPLNPQRPFWELSKRLPDNAIVTVDSGTSAVWYARDIQLRRGMLASLSGGLASMGAAVPYAIAAKQAYPERPVIALVGDGAMQMNGLNGLITIARLWPGWADKRLLVMVLNNRDLNMVTWEQRVQGGDPKYEPSQVLPDFAYADYARMLGLEGLRVMRPDAIAPALEAALSAGKPMVLEMMVDPEVGALPPAFERKQLQAYLSALVHGDSGALQSVKATMKQWWAGKFAGSDDKH